MSYDRTEYYTQLINIWIAADSREEALEAWNETMSCDYSMSYREFMTQIRYAEKAGRLDLVKMYPPPATTDWKSIHEKFVAYADSLPAAS